MTSLRGWGQSAQKSQASKASTGLFSSNRDYKDPLRSNEPEPSKAPAGSKAFAGPETPAGPEALPGPPQAPLLPIFQDRGVNCYSQQDLDRIIQTFLHVSKGGSGDKLKAKTLDVYCGRSLMEYYNFCQQCEDHFATCGATGPKQVPFTASFLWD